MYLSVIFIFQCEKLILHPCYFLLPYTATKLSSTVLDSVLVHVGGLHRLLSGWNHDEYLLAAQIYHGTRPVGSPVTSRAGSRTKGFYDRVPFDSW